MLNAVAAQGVDVSGTARGSTGGEAMEEADGGAATSGALESSVVDAIVGKCGELSAGRKGRKAPDGLCSRDEVASFAGGGDASSSASFNPHEASKPGVTCMATPRLSPLCDVVLTGGMDKKGVLSEVASGQVIAKLVGHSKKVTCCDLAAGSRSALPLAVTGSADTLVKVCGRHRQTPRGMHVSYDYGCFV